MTTATSRRAQTSSGPSHATPRKETHMSDSNSSTSSSSTQESPGNNQAPWNSLADLGRQQFAMCAEMTSAMYRGSEALRKIQQKTAHQASARHEAAAQQLRASGQPNDLLALQSELLRADLQSAGQYWQQFAEVALQTQREMMGSVSHMMHDSEKNDGVTSALQAFQAAIQPMATSYFDSSLHGANEHSAYGH